jgi:hypothetical protein
MDPLSLWTPYGPPEDRLWTAYGPPMDPYLCFIAGPSGDTGHMDPIWTS